MWRPRLGRSVSAADAAVSVHIATEHPVGDQSRYIICPCPGSNGIHSFCGSALARHLQLLLLPTCWRRIQQLLDGCCDVCGPLLWLIISGASQKEKFLLGPQTLQCRPSILLPSQVVDVSCSDLKQPSRLCEVPNVRWLSPVGCWGWLVVVFVGWWWFSSCQDVSKTFCVPRKPPLSRVTRIFEQEWVGDLYCL